MEASGCMGPTIMSTNLTTTGGNPIADNQNSLSVVGDGW
jgi:hypothetical protein